MAASAVVSIAAGGAAGSAPVRSVATRAPSARRSSAWRIPLVLPSEARTVWSLACRVAFGTPVAVRSDPVSSSPATSTRTDATSPPTTALVAASVKWDVTIEACAEAVTPTSTRKAP